MQSSRVQVITQHQTISNISRKKKRSKPSQNQLCPVKCNLAGSFWIFYIYKKRWEISGGFPHSYLHNYPSGRWAIDSNIKVTLCLRHSCKRSRSLSSKKKHFPLKDHVFWLVPARILFVAMSMVPVVAGETTEPYPILRFHITFTSGGKMKTLNRIE